MTRLLEIDDERYKHLKLEYTKARKAKQEIFLFYGAETTTEFASGWLRECDMRRKRLGIRRYIMSTNKWTKGKKQR